MAFSRDKVVIVAAVAAAFRRSRSPTTFRVSALSCMAQLIRPTGHIATGLARDEIV